MLPMVADQYGNLADAVASLTALQASFRAQNDRRAVFATCYLVMTTDMQAKVDAGFFSDNAWVERYAVDFANYYRRALVQYDASDPGLPTCWQIAFDAAANNSTLVIQDLVLGINAHVNHDLALALKHVGIDPQSDRYADHVKVNQVLSDATMPIENAISALYAPGLGLIGRALGPLGADFTNFDIDAAREHAWMMAVALHNAQSDEQSAKLAAGLDDTASMFARLILSPNIDLPFIVPLLKHMEGATNWMQVIT